MDTEAATQAHGHLARALVLLDAATGHADCPDAVRAAKERAAEAAALLATNGYCR